MQLRPVRFSDAPFFGEILRNADILKTSGVDKPLTQSWFLLWCWLKRKYSLLYCIEADSTRIGFIGLYNLTHDSGEVTLVIFDKAFRRRGYGTKAFAVFVQYFSHSLSLRKLIIRVAIDNHPAMSFWTKLGFREPHVRDDITVMSMDLKSGQLNTNHGVMSGLCHCE